MTAEASLTYGELATERVAAGNRVEYAYRDPMILLRYAFLEESD